MSTTIEFWGGLGVIGSSKVLVRGAGHRVLLDFGLDIPDTAELFRAPVRSAPGRELADRLRVGGAPRIGGVYDPQWLDPSDPLPDDPGPVSLFVSHPHIDHAGLVGFVAPHVATYAHADAVEVFAALEHSGSPLPGRAPAWHGLQDGQSVRCGDLSVQCLRVDHDVPGASGYLVTTPDGTLAFTGDLRFHGRRPELSSAFAERVAGCDVLVTEGTTLAWEQPADRPRDEDDVAADFAAVLAGSSGLVLASLYSRDVERAVEFIAVAARHGRTYLWPAATAMLLRSLGVDDVVARDELPDADLHASPGRYVVQPDPDDLPGLLRLPIVPGTVLAHANGEPLGDFDPRWSLFVDWLRQLGAELRVIGCSGHAAPDALHAMVEAIGPRVVFPIHTTAPRRLHPPAGVRRVIASYGVRYDFAGDPVASG